MRAQVVLIIGFSGRQMSSISFSVPANTRCQRSSTHASAISSKWKNRENHQNHRGCDCRRTITPLLLTPQ